MEKEPDYDGLAILVFPFVILAMVLGACFARLIQTGMGEP